MAPKEYCKIRIIIKKNVHKPKSVPVLDTPSVKKTKSVSSAEGDDKDLFVLHVRGREPRLDWVIWRRGRGGRRRIDLRQPLATVWVSLLKAAIEDNQDQVSGGGKGKGIVSKDF